MRIATAQKPSESPAARRGGDSHQGMVRGRPVVKQSRSEKCGEDVPHVWNARSLPPAESSKCQCEKTTWAAAEKLAEKIFNEKFGCGDADSETANIVSRTGGARAKRRDDGLIPKEQVSRERNDITAPSNSVARPAGAKTAHVQRRDESSNS